MSPATTSGGSRAVTGAPSSPATADDGLSTPERHAAARDAYLTSVAEGSSLTGEELGRRSGRTDRWADIRSARPRPRVSAEATATASPDRQHSETPMKRPTLDARNPWMQLWVATKRTWRTRASAGLPVQLHAGGSRSS